MCVVLFSKKNILLFAFVGAASVFSNQKSCSEFNNTNDNSAPTELEQSTQQIPQAAMTLAGTYRVKGKTVELTPEMAKIFLEMEKKYGHSVENLILVGGIESDLDPENVNPASKAKGLFQFKFMTFIESLYKHGKEIGLAKEASLIEKYKSKEVNGKPWYSYRLKNPADTLAIQELAFDPYVNTELYVKYNAPKQRKLSKKIGRKPKSGEITMLNNLGLGGAEALIVAAKSSNMPDTLAQTFFDNITGPSNDNGVKKVYKKDITEQNQHLVSNGKTVAELYQDFIRNGRVEKISNYSPNTKIILSQNPSKKQTPELSAAL